MKQFLNSIWLGTVQFQGNIVKKIGNSGSKKDNTMIISRTQNIQSAEEIV